MYQHAIEKIKKSIFPLFSQISYGNQAQITVTGTGYFIDTQGHFISALHVITESPQNANFFYRGNIPEHIYNPPLLIREVYRDAKRDVFLGKIDGITTQPVDISLQKPKPGKSVCLCGYPLAQLSTNPDQSINVSNVRQYWQPTYVIDSITIVDHEKNYVGFMTQDISLNGMSGGPVFDTEGMVWGMDTAFLTREIPQRSKPPIQVYNGIAVDNETLADVYARVSV